MPPLASYAVSEKISRGREKTESKPKFRDEFQRDRDRIIHSTSFRRLVYKTQVFVNHEGDLYRTRLTHSLEVSQIARTIAASLGLNETLVESIALAHDLGHTPFGHAGQDELDNCMNDFGGFEHNLQSLRIVDVLEQRYPNFPGLNLTILTRFLRFLPLCLFAKLRADSTERKPHLLSASAFLVGRPFSSFIGPFIPANLAAKEILRGLTPRLTGGFKLEPSFLLK